MDIKKIYLLIAAVIVAGVAIVFLLGDSEPSADELASQLPPGHPNVSEMEQGQAAPGGPDKSNVRADVMERLAQMQARVDAAPEKDTTDVLTLAQMLYFSHRIEEAVKYFERYLKAMPGNTDAMFDLAVAYYDLGQHPKALAITEKILQKEPSNTKAMYNIGAIHATMGDKVKARAAWDKLKKMAPGSEDAKRAEESAKQL